MAYGPYGPAGGQQYPASNPYGQVPQQGYPGYPAAQVNPYQQYQAAQNANQAQRQHKRLPAFIGGVLATVLLTTGAAAGDIYWSGGSHIPFSDGISEGPGGPGAVPTPSGSPEPSTEPSETPSPEPSEKPSSEPTKKPEAQKPTIVIDPGHSGRNKDYDAHVTVNGKNYTIRDHDYPNHPEMEEVYSISRCIGKVLEKDGFKVVLTKDSVNKTVSLSKRAEIANKAKADMFVIIHNDHSAGSSFQAVYDQTGATSANGGGREMYRVATDNQTKIIFDNPEVAKASHKYAKAISKERAAAQGTPVRFDYAHLGARTGIAQGNLWWVMLLSNVPAIYNEMGAKTGGSPTTMMTKDAMSAYGTGILNGIEVSVKPPGGLPNDYRTKNKTRMDDCLGA